MRKREEEKKGKSGRREEKERREGRKGEKQGEGERHHDLKF